MRVVNATLAERICFTDVEHTHTHNFGHLILPLQGALNLKTMQQALIVDSRHLLLLPPNCKHTYFAKERNEFLVFYIPYFVFSNITSDEANFLEIDERWRALRFLMLSEYQNNKADTSAINQLLHYSFQLIQQKEESLSLSYIHENYYRNIALEELARLEHYHVSYYSQWFEKKIGVTPLAYILRIRLNEAKRLLRETDYSVFDIAQQVGYEYQSSLTRLFKQLEGTTPRVYRQQFFK